jgi:hypothetical protein
MAAIVNSLMRVAVEGYTNPGGLEAYKPTSVYTDALASLLAFIISIAIVLFLGLWLWNFSVVPLFEFARPAKSVFQILGLMVFLAIIKP